MTAFIMPAYRSDDKRAFFIPVIFYVIAMSEERTIMRIQDLKIDNTSFGRAKMLVDIRPYYNYAENSKDIEGYKYKVLLPAHKMDSLEVKIAGAKLLELADGEYPMIDFEGLEAKAYVIDGKAVITATAKNIRVISNQNKA